VRAAELVRRRCLWPEALHSHPPNPELSEQLFSRVGYVEGLNDGRTTLAGFFNSLLDLEAGFGFR
jgi:hypothetical protein